MCGIIKPLSEYHFRQDTGHYRTNCKSCRNISEAARRYGISPHAILSMRESQKDRCAICQIHFSDIDHAAFTHSPLVVDHCHETKRVRGLLCPKCNLGIGQFNDNPQLLKQAAKYLQASVQK